MRYIRVAYADPPYPGCAHLYPERREVDHCKLIRKLARDYPDGWALSTSSVALPDVLRFCPDGVRVAAWVKPFCSFKPGINPAYAWEPVIWTGGRSAKDRGGRDAETVRDWVSASITLKRGLAGAKPQEFCYWLFRLLGLRAGDTLDDLFPGTNAVMAAWGRWIAQTNLFGPDWQAKGESDD